MKPRTKKILNFALIFGTLAMVLLYFCGTTRFGIL